MRLRHAEGLARFGTIMNSVKTEIGAKERKRALKAMPPRPRIDAGSPGCVGALLGYLALCLSLYWATRSRWWLALAAPALLLQVGGVIGRVRDRIVLSESRRLLESRGIRCLVVYSESPTWEEYIRTAWLPRLGQRAVTLNWSERSSWPNSLEVRLFKRFIGPSGTAFNPAVLVLRGLQRPQVFRFYYEFQQAKHGRRQYLETLESELFDELGV